jgi:hypothetical protein
MDSPKMEIKTLWLNEIDELILSTLITAYSALPMKIEAS